MSHVWRKIDELFISHILFVDDKLIFCGVTTEE